MRAPRTDDRVRLTKDIPELELHRGSLGTVRSTWFAPSTAYEVEFDTAGSEFHTRALIVSENLEVTAEENATVHSN